jgi:replicative DNA helicase
MKSNKRYFYQVPSHVALVEAAQLYDFMATGETTKTEYRDKRHQCIFYNLQHLLGQIGRMGTQQLAAYLTEQNLLNAAGGLGYIQKVFDSLEPAEAVC